MNNKHLKAANGYLRGLTRAEALRGAGYSEVVATTSSGDIFGRPDVKAYIEKRQRAMVERNEVTEDWIVARLKEVASSSVGDLIEVSEEGVPQWNWKKLTPAMRAAIGNFTVDEYVEGRGEDKALRRRIKVQMQDKLRALEMLGKYLGMWKEKVEVSGDAEMMNALAAARARVGKKNGAE